VVDSWAEAAASGDWIGQMLVLQREIRGGILEAAISVERGLDLILANHFCHPKEDRWWQLYSLILASGDVTFRHKAEIAIEILGIAYPELLKKHPTIKTDLNRIVRLRNEIAHSEFAMSSGFGNGTPPDHINLVKYGKGKQTIKRFTRAQAQEEVAKANVLFLVLAEIAAEVQRNHVKDNLSSPKSP